MRAFRAAYLLLEARIKLFISLPFEKPDSTALKGGTAQIGELETGAPVGSA